MNSMDLVLHGLAIKKHAAAQDIVGVTGLSAAVVAAQLAKAEATGRAVAAQGKYLLSPLARIALEADYSRHYAEVRLDAAFMAAYAAFERINIDLKGLITDWQTVNVGGQRVPNDHHDKPHDERVIDRLGDLHERASGLLAKLAARLPRLAFYPRQLMVALEKAEDGAIEWVSDVKIESYHTLWFELHEDLLRIVGRERSE